MLANNQLSCSQKLSMAGFTLIELILFIVIVSIASVGLFAVLNQHNLSSVNPMLQVRALELAQRQMDAIYGKRYDDAVSNGGFPPCGSGETDPPAPACSAIGPDSGESNESDFDDLDDYHGFSANIEGYLVDVTVAVVADFGGQPAKLITVNVAPPAGAGRAVTLSAYRANY